ncbi:ArsR/SmtB family transcription factor [Krasilnikovia sp. MM14-A1004]|uniref:ArsR/SmtB family transcription factor n=1 Tax=Krasilnikovia sp. MM14-A1004 TaxID=3373541 RepID=UPI00399C76BC
MAEYLDADPRALRALAHPLRVSLLHELHARGTANATVLAAATGKPVNAVSFHLRQLVGYGLVEDAPDVGGDGRERWYRPTSTDGLRISSRALGHTPEGREALQAIKQQTAAQWLALVEQFFEPHNEQAVRVSNEESMLLTDEEAHHCATELAELLDRWSKHGRQAGDGVRRTYRVMTMLMPLHDQESQA